MKVMMSEQQFALDKLYYSIMTPIEKISVGRCYMTYREVVDTLNEQQVTIIELERKLKKYAKIGEEQLKQISDLQDELNECRARPTDERGVVKVEYR